MPMNYERPTTAACAHCKRPFKIGPHGRVPTFCKPSCRTMNFVAKNRTGIKRTPEDRQRLRTWQLLQDAGIVPAAMPPPLRRKLEDEQ